MSIELITHPTFNPYRVEDLYAARGWQTELVKASNFDLVRVTTGAAIECGDGRSGRIKKRKFYGPRVLGQINTIAALETGGDMYGFMRAAEWVSLRGQAPGTHGAEHEGEGCAAFGLWRTGQYSPELGLHPFNLPLNLLEEELNYTPTQWIKMMMKMLGGKHFTLPDTHVEEAFTFNPFIGTTVNSNGDRFVADDWFIEGIDFDRRNKFKAETIEKARPSAAKIEILTP